MKVIPQNKVIDPYDYDRIIHGIKKISDKIDARVDRKD